MKISKHKTLKRFLGLCQYEGCKARNLFTIDIQQDGKNIVKTVHVCEEHIQDVVYLLAQQKGGADK